MIFDPYISTTRYLFKAWKHGTGRVRVVLTVVAIIFLAGMATGLLSEFLVIDKKVGNYIAAGLIATAFILTIGVVAYQHVIEEEARERKIENVEQRLREHPERPQLAWDVARTKLESYLDRNLSQVRSIYWLTLLVMVCGFGLVMYGLYQVSKNPAQLPVSIVASASGILISFIGGSFLIIYRSILSQSKEYVTVLERINAVGMAVQVIASIPDTGADLKNKTTADLAKQLLGLYAAFPQQQKRPSAKQD
ncbi:MAG TPA: hypothetical protein VGE32_06650 [Cellvibrio sp.]